MPSPPSAPGTPPVPAAKARRPAPARAPWGWLEWFLVAQTFIPALLFIPYATSVRIVVRIASFVLAFIAWYSIAASGRSLRGAGSFPPGLWLKLATGWLGLMILNPMTNSLPAGLAQAMIYVAVFSAAFWAPAALKSPAQVGRLMMISLACAGLASLVGLGQVFRPGTFNPPVIQGVQSAPGVMDDSLSAQASSYEDAHGNRIIRPCGLTDSAGGASAAAPIAVLVGLAFALRPIGVLRRLACLGLSFAGMAVIYYSQVRMIMMLTVICLAVLVVVFVAQRDYGRATLLGGLGVALVLGALAWVASRSGWVVVERFIGLANDFGGSYDKSSRGNFIRHALEEVALANPLGMGLGWWGTVNGAFGDRSRPSVWVEVMIPALIVDGGIPLLLFYAIAVVLALADTLRVALRSRDPGLRYWAAVVFASNLGILATSFSYVTFVTAMGTSFWLLSAVIHAADIRVRAAAPRARAAPRLAPAPGPPPGPRPAPAPAAP